MQERTLQVKSTEDSVGDPIASALYGKVSLGEYALLVTLGMFTAQAQSFAGSKSNLRLIGGWFIATLPPLARDMTQGAAAAVTIFAIMSVGISAILFVFTYFIAYRNPPIRPSRPSGRSWVSSPC